METDSNVTRNQTQNPHLVNSNVWRWKLYSKEEHAESRHVRSAISQNYESFLASNPPSTQPRSQLGMATCPGQRTMEASRGNGYTPVRATPMMTMIKSNKWLLQKTGTKPVLFQSTQRKIIYSWVVTWDLHLIQESALSRRLCYSLQHWFLSILLHTTWYKLQETL